MKPETKFCSAVEDWLEYTRQTKGTAKWHWDRFPPRTWIYPASFIPQSSIIISIIIRGWRRRPKSGRQTQSHPNSRIKTKDTCFPDHIRINANQDSGYFSLQETNRKVERRLPYHTETDFCTIVQFFIKNYLKWRTVWNKAIFFLARLSLVLTDCKLPFKI